MRRALLVLAMLLVLGSAVLAADAPATATATATVCAAVKDRACEGAGETFAANVGQLVCLSEVKGGKDKVVHAWFFGDKEVASIELPIKGDRWRTWSVKRVVPTMKGGWRVEVRDAAGAVLATAKFKV